MVDEIVMQRLGLIRYLYEKAMEESRQTEPYGSTSILKFHDSVELFLDLACDKFGILAKNTPRFKDYWTELERYLQGQSLSEKRSMDRLNDARVSFKHHGNLPHASSIEKFRVNVTDFFEENTRLIFGVEFNNISMTYLIQNPTVRSLLDEANILIEQEKKWDALGKIAIAFSRLVDGYYENNNAFLHRSQFYFGESMNYISSYDMGIKNRKFEEFVSKVTKSIEALQDAMKVLSLGLDYQRYIRFQRLVPLVTRSFVGEYHAHIGEPNPENQPSSNNCRFCYDFVVASAIQLQNFDYNLEM